jgi:ATP-dependent DNA helicase DinG
LAKRAIKAVMESNGEKDRGTANLPERQYVSFEEEPKSTQTREAESGAKPSMAEVFGPGGLLERCMIGGYEHRRAQLQMAQLVHEAFEEHHHVVVEAGTGTGKTLAYLLPAICSGRRVVISTATKSLQEQLYQKDIPFLQKHFAPELKVAVMKGRSNFLCRAKLNQMADQPVLKGMEEMEGFRQIQDWSKLTETGDRAELSFLPDDS